MLKCETARLSGLAPKQLTAIVRLAIDDVRLKAADLPAATTKDELYRHVESLLAQRIAATRRARLTRVINATGVVVHTNLGRAPLSPAAIDAMADAAAYCSLEYDLASGTRGRRSPLSEHLICNITGSEAAIVVNNCAAAAFLVLKCFAGPGEVVVSRGHLVEIGGDFRIPDILAQSGAVMREVGTTNRTTLDDFSNAIDEYTRLILRVHPSNFTLVGFTAQPTLAELSGLARTRGIILYEDIGSGTLVDLTPFGIDDEPRVQDSLAAGTDIVSFSGDKMLGGPQCGIIAGRRDLIDKLRKHPLMRALRVDKTIAAALEATLLSYMGGKEIGEIPVLAMLAQTRGEIQPRADKFITLVKRDDAFSTFRFDAIDGNSVVGGGAAPAAELPTKLIAVSHVSLSAAEIEAKLRSNSPPVITRIEADRVLIDLRTVPAGDEDALIAALASIK